MMPADASGSATITGVTDPLAFLHGFGARALLLFAVVLGVWGTYLYFRKHELNGGFRSSFLIMGGLTALQGLIGLVAFITGGRPTELLHLVYGAFAVLFIPGAYFYAQGGTRRREAVILAGAAWIVSIAYFRGIATG
jgi:FtsH-binding integral membrane protein